MKIVQEIVPDYMRTHYELWEYEGKKAKKGENVHSKAANNGSVQKIDGEGSDRHPGSGRSTNGSGDTEHGAGPADREGGIRDLKKVRKGRGRK